MTNLSVHLTGVSLRFTPVDGFVVGHTTNMMNEQIIRERIVEHGAKPFKSPQKFIRFTKDNDVDILLRNVDEITSPNLCAYLGKLFRPRS